MSFKNFKLTTFINMYGLFKIPLVLFVNPRVVESTEEKFVLKIPLRFRTKNHLGSMYFGALGIGAELSIAAAAVVSIAESKKKIDFIFKDFSAEYLKRGDGNVHFVCEEISAVKALIAEAAKSNDRVERKLKGYACVPSSKNPTEAIMTYELTLSVKNRSKVSG